jgi:CARDB
VAPTAQLFGALVVPVIVMSMRRCVLTLALACAVLPGTAASASAKKLPGKAQARILDCKQGSFSVEAAMTTADKSQRLAVRYEVLQRLPGEDFKIRKDALGVATGWVMADPGYTGYKNDQVVTSVTQGATYRVRVRFRWTDAAGHVVARISRVTNACKQKETRADLRINRLSVEPGPGPATRRYVAIVRNVGRTPTGSFDVLLSVGDREYRRTVAALGPGQRTTVVFQAPRCRAGEAVIAGADPDKVVDEASEDNNSAVAACPS